MKKILYIVGLLFLCNGLANGQIVLGLKGEKVNVTDKGIFSASSNLDTARISLYYLKQPLSLNTRGNDHLIFGQYGTSTINDLSTTSNNKGLREISVADGSSLASLRLTQSAFFGSNGILSATNGTATSQLFLAPTTTYFSSDNGTNIVRFELRSSDGKLGLQLPSTPTIGQYLGVTGVIGNTALLEYVTPTDNSSTNELIQDVDFQNGVLTIIDAGTTYEVPIPSGIDNKVGTLNSLSNISNIQFSGTGVTVTSGGAGIANVTITGGGGSGSVPIMNNTLISNDQFTHNNGTGVVTTFNLSPYRQTVDALTLTGNTLGVSLSGDNVAPSTINLGTFAQTLDFNPITRQVNLSAVNGAGGGSFTLPVDTDAQTLTFNTGTNRLAISNGNTVDLTSLKTADVAIASVSRNDITVGSTVSNINFSSNFNVINNGGGKVTIDLGNLPTQDGNGIYDADNNGNIMEVYDFITFSTEPTTFNLSQNMNYLLNNNIFRIYNQNNLQTSNQKSDIQFGGGVNSIRHYYNSDYTFLNQQLPVGNLAIALGIKKPNTEARQLGFNNNGKLIINTDATVSNTAEVGWVMTYTGDDLEGNPIIDLTEVSTGGGGVADGNNFITGGSFNSGILTLTGNGGGAGATMNLDGRYVQSTTLNGAIGAITNTGTAASNIFNVSPFIVDVTGVTIPSATPTGNQRFGYNSTNNLLYIRNGSNWTLLEDNDWLGSRSNAGSITHRGAVIIGSLDSALAIANNTKLFVDGRVRFNGYGLGSREIQDLLGTTASPFITAFAIGGQVVEREFIALTPNNMISTQGNSDATGLELKNDARAGNTLSYNAATNELYGRRVISITGTYDIATDKTTTMINIPNPPSGLVWNVESIIWSRDGFTANGALTMRIIQTDTEQQIGNTQNLGIGGLIYSSTNPSPAITFTNGNRYELDATATGLTTGTQVTVTLILIAQ